MISHLMLPALILGGGLKEDDPVPSSSSAVTPSKAVLLYQQRLTEAEQANRVFYGAGDPPR